MYARRILALVLLLCGFSSAPLFSLEQRAATDLAAFSAPQVGVRHPAAASRLDSHAAGGGRGEGAQGPGRAATDACRGKPCWRKTGARAAPGKRTPASEIRLTYRSNAPPNRPVST